MYIVVSCRHRGVEARNSPTIAVAQRLKRGNLLSPKQSSFGAASLSYEGRMRGLIYALRNVD